MTVAVDEKGLNHAGGPALSERFLTLLAGRQRMGNDVLTISYDQATGIVRTVAQGSSPAAEVTRYLAQLQPCARRARSETGRLLHLVDASASAVQPRDSFDILAQAARDHGHPDDLTAVVMRSQPARMQVALLSTHVSICLFADIEEAEAWLMTESRPATVLSPR